MRYSPLLTRRMMVDQVLGRDVLEQERSGAGLDGLEELVLVLGGGQRDDAGAGHLALDALRRLDAAGRRQRQVEQDDVGRELGGRVDGAARIVRLGDDLEVALGLEDLAHADAEEGVVVDEQDLHPQAGFPPVRSATAPLRSCVLTRRHSTLLSLSEARAAASCLRLRGRPIVQDRVVPARACRPVPSLPPGQRHGLHVARSIGAADGPSGAVLTRRAAIGEAEEPRLGARDREVRGSSTRQPRASLVEQRRRDNDLARRRPRPTGPRTCRLSCHDRRQSLVGQGHGVPIEGLRQPHRVVGDDDGRHVDARAPPAISPRRRGDGRHLALALPGLPRQERELQGTQERRPRRRGRWARG